jgi:hypothetical protein
MYQHLSEGAAIVSVMLLSPTRLWLPLLLLLLLLLL